jgi:2-dehydropantoate 2-reductase
MTRVAVYGAGAVGGYLAWQLARAGHEVSAIARGAHLEAIRRDGLRLRRHDGGTVTARVVATDNPATLGPQEAVLVTLKHPALAGAAEALGQLASSGAPVVFANNGIPWWMESELDPLDPGGRLAEAVPAPQRVGCVVKASLEVAEPGVIAMDTASARFIIGPASADALAAASAIAGLFEKAGVAASLAADLRPAVWDKLILNVCFGLPAALLGLPVGATASQPEMRVMAKALLAEVRALAAARGVATTVGDDVLDDASVLSSQHHPSLLQDLNRGREAEIDALVQAPMALARMAGVATPTLDMLGAMLTAKARALGSYRGGFNG